MCEEAEQLHFECCVSPPVKWNRHKQFTEIYWGHCHCDMRSTSIVLLKYLDSNANILAQKHNNFVWIFGDYMWSAQWHMAIGRVSSCWGEAPGAFHAPLLEWGHALRRHQICRRTNIHHDFHNRICHLWRSAEREGIHASCTQKVDKDAATGPCAIMTCGVWSKDISRTITAAGTARWNPNTLILKANTWTIPSIIICKINSKHCLYIELQRFVSSHQRNGYYSRHFPQLLLSLFSTVTEQSQGLILGKSFL